MIYLKLEFAYPIPQGVYKLLSGHIIQHNLTELGREELSIYVDDAAGFDDLLGLLLQYNNWSRRVAI